jgi:hypothetical protein
MPRRCQGRRLVGVIDLANEFDQWIVEQRLDLVGEIVAVGSVDFGSQLQRDASALGDRNRAVRALLRRYTPRKARYWPSGLGENGSSDPGMPCCTVPSQRAKRRGLRW